MNATLIATVSVLALLCLLFYGAYKYGLNRQAKLDEIKIKDNAEQELEDTKKVVDREKDINVKPLPLDTNSVIDRL